MRIYIVIAQFTRNLTIVIIGNLIKNFMGRGFIPLPIFLF
nr:MAG TPA: hypothetical protein [Caudoviricetes sp.]